MFWVGVFLVEWLVVMAIWQICHDIKATRADYAKARKANYGIIHSVLFTLFGQSAVDFIKSVSFLNIIRNIILFCLLFMTGPFALVMFIYWDKIYKPVMK